MKKIINNASKIMGMFGIMLALAVMLVGAPAASANSITATGQGKLTTYVINETTGDAIAQATIAVYKANSPATADPVLKGTTDNTGVFASYLPAGKYRVVVTANGYSQFSEYVVIEKGYNTSIKVALQSASDR